MSIGKRAQKSAVLFIDKAREIHGDKYNYDLVVYTRARDKVTIICPIHGRFEKTPNKHLGGQGCPQCGFENMGKRYTKSFTQFLKDANKIHDNKYSYVESSYVNTKTAMTIVCPEHGEFEQTPDVHINKGTGCQLCRQEQDKNKVTVTTEEWIAKAIAVHGNKYDYSKVSYYRSNKNITIICPNHDEFQQTPSNHLAGKGCRHCAQGGGFDTSKAAILYYVSIDGGTYYKIGITNNTVFTRFSKDTHPRIRVIKQWDYPLGYDALSAEQRILKAHKDSLIDPETKVLRDGNTEIFNIDVLGLDYTDTK